MNTTARKIIGWWLFTGCLMVFFQVIVGGATRLTESGLSITEWKPIKGIVPPLNEKEWNEEFELYKQKAQYKTINEGMTLPEFKLIYFWEYFHRFWARFMGIVFAVGFAYFIYKKWFDRDLLYKISPLFIWGGIEGAYGWYMVSRGLKGIFVPPLHLSTHLIIALSLFAYLVWLTLYVWRGKQIFSTASAGVKNLSIAILVVLFLQILLGGVLSGMKAGLAYPTWPNMNGEFIPSALFSEKISFTGFTVYNAQDFWGRTFIQFMHRMTAYTLILLVVIFFFKAKNITTDKLFKTGLNFFPVLVLLQACIGIITVLNCVGKIPVMWGVFHQAGAMLLIAGTVFIIFHLYNKPTDTHTT